MEQKIEREWKRVQCPRREERIALMCEWDITSKRGRILRKILRQIDCHNPQLGILGEPGCDWPCEQIILRREK